VDGGERLADLRELDGAAGAVLEGVGVTLGGRFF
jgi:hypothetical protein